MTSRNILYAIAILFVCSSNASVILLKSGLSENYMTLNLTDHGDVALSTCAMTSKPVADCDPQGQATMVVTRSVFDTKLKAVTEYDQITLTDRENIRGCQRDIQNLKKALKEIETRLASSQKLVSDLEGKIAVLNRQIEDVEKRLEDPNLDPNDRAELESFLKKAKTAKSALEKDLKKAQLDLGQNERDKKDNLESTTENVDAINEYQKKIAQRKLFLENKAIELTSNLDQKQIAVAYEKESLYFMAYFIFDPSLRVVDDSGCTVAASFGTSFNNIRATLNLTEGVFPKNLSIGTKTYEIYNGLTLDLMMSELGRPGWNASREFFEYLSPRSRSKVVCDDPNGIDGRNNVEWGKVFGGDLISGDTRCSGKPARRYHFLNIYYVGNLNAKAAAQTCTAIKPSVKGYIQQAKLLDGQFYGGNAYETDLIQLVYKSTPLLQSLKVESHPYLKNGFYSWASTEKPYLWEYTAEKANLMDFRKTEHEKTIFDWELPSLCYTHQDLDYCD